MVLSPTHDTLNHSPFQMMISSMFAIGSTYPFSVIGKLIVGSRYYLRISHNGKTTIPGCGRWSFRVPADSNQAKMSENEIKTLGPIYCRVSGYKPYHSGSIQFPLFTQVPKPPAENDITVLMEPFDDTITRMEEGEALEKKTSIVFPPGQRGSPEIETQLGFHIMRVIAGMANQAGGYIYIGLHDANGTVCGIDQDLPHLSLLMADGKREYSATYDSFLRIIQDCVNRDLGPYARTLIRPVPLRAFNGAVVCRIRVLPCRSPSGPVLYKNRDLFLRVGSETTIIRLSERERFIAE